MLKKLKKLLNWSDKVKPEYDLNTELYENLKPFRLPLISFVIMLLIGGLAYVAIDGFALMDAIYQASITFTTVGYTEVAPISNAGRFFTITYILIGFAFFTFSIGILIEVLKKGVLLNIIKERKMLYKIARLKNHFVICHQNNFTIELAKQFRLNHIPFVVIDNSEHFLQEAERLKYPYYINEDPHSNNALLKAHLSSAKGLVTLSKNTTDNIAQIVSVRLYEKEIALKKPYFIMTNADNQSDVEKLKKLGANSVIFPSKLVAQRLSAISLRPYMEDFLEKFLYAKHSSVIVEEIAIPNYSWLRFKKIKETHLREITNVSIIGIKDESGKFEPMPKGDVIIGSNCKLLTVGTSEGIKKAKRLILKTQKPDEVKFA